LSHSAAYDAFINDPVKSVNILLEVEPRDIHPIWTSVSGLSNSYSTAFETVVGESSVQGGLYRTATGLAQSGVALTQMTHAGFVDFTQGSWYHNEERPVTNLALWGSRPDQGSWGKVRLSVGTTAAAGVYTLDEDGTSANTHFIRQNITTTADANLIASAILKAENRDWVRIRVVDQSAVTDGFFGYFNVSAGTQGSTGVFGSGTFLDSGMSDAGGGFYHCWVKGNIAAGETDSQIDINVAEGDLDVTFDGLSQVSLSVKGMQLEEAEQYNAVGTTYVETRASSVTLPKDTFWLHMPDSSDPEDDPAIVSTFRVHFATDPIVIDGIYYEPRITPDNLPDINQELEAIFYGTTKTVAEGEIGINNADGLFDSLANTWAWRNARVGIYLGGPGLTHTPGGGGDYERVGCFLVEDFTPGLGVADLSVRDLQKVTLRELPLNRFTRGKFHVTNAPFSFPNLPAEEEGRFAPIFYGSKKNLPLIPSNDADESEFGWIYYASDYSNGGGTNRISNVYGDGVVLVNDVHYDLSPTLSKVQIGGSLPSELPIGGDGGDGNLEVKRQEIIEHPPSHTFTCDAEGVGAQGNPWETSTDYLKYYGEIVCDIYYRLLGVPKSDIDSAAALAVDAAEPLEQAIYIDSLTTARKIIRLLEIGVMGRTIRSVDGKITPTIWTPFEDATTLETVTKEDIAVFEPDLKVEAIFSRAIGLGDKDPSDGSFKIIKIINSDEIKFHQLDGREDDRQIETALKSPGGVGQIAGRVVHLTKTVDTNVHIVETGIRLMDVNVGDRLTVSFPRAPHETGAWTDQVVEVLQTTKRFAPTPEVELVVSDLLGGNIAEFLGEWTNNSAPNWATATDEEKEDSGFWCDSAGRPDPADSTTKGKSLWW
jgi:hypothetical protein